VCTGEPMRRDVLARLSEMQDSTAMTTYHQPNTTMGLALYWAGDLEQARPLLERAAQQALTLGEEWDRLGVLLTLANLEWDAGNQALAERHRQLAEESSGEFGEGLLWLVNLDARYALERGDLAEARAKADQGLALAERTSRAWQVAGLVQILASVELASGRPELAHGRLEWLRNWLAASGFGPAGQAKAGVWSQDIEALIALGRLEDAKEVLVELRSRADACDSPSVDALALRGEGLLLAARGDLAAAIDAMDRALVAHACRYRPFEHGRTLLEKGVLERRAKRKAAAKQTLEEALAILEPLGAQLWVSRTRDELSRIGLRRPSGSDGLTPAQTRVAELVAAGLTNPEVARKLHMSLRTVESHLSRVYREYGVRSRSQLTAALTAPAGAAR
jgi:DNA-binding CsgD family transcriptional regulator